MYNAEDEGFNTIMVAQTPITATPAAIVYNLNSATQGKMSRQIDSVVEAIKSNLLVSLDAEHPLKAAWSRLDALYDLTENWNGNDVASPRPDSIERAKKWLQELHSNVQYCGEDWQNPHVSTNEDGDVVFEWSRGQKKLAVYITPDDAYYIKAWGASVAAEMSDGDASSPDERISLWWWLREIGENA